MARNRLGRGRVIPRFGDGRSEDTRPGEVDLDLVPRVAEIKTQAVEYKDGDTVLEGYLAYDDAVKGKRCRLSSRRIPQRSVMCKPRSVKSTERRSSPNRRRSFVSKARTSDR